MNLVRGLGDRGHEADLWAASRGYPLGSGAIDGVHVRLFPEFVPVPLLHFVTTMARGLMPALLKQRLGIDVLHIHFTRDLVALPTALMARTLGIKYVLQPHGQVVVKSSFLVRLFDAVLTRPALKGAAQILCLNLAEEAELRRLQPTLTRYSVLPNGIQPIEGRASEEASDTCEVLFLARMHRRKRPVTFVRAAAEVLSRGKVARFHLVGPDEGEGNDVIREIQATGAEGGIVYEGALPFDRTNDRLARCDIYVLPAVDEPFGMTVIEALALGRPVVVTDSCGLAPAVRSAGAGLVVDSSQASLTNAIDWLVCHPEERRSMGARGRKLVEREFSIDSVVNRLSAIYATL